MENKIYRKPKYCRHDFLKDEEQPVNEIYYTTYHCLKCNQVKYSYPDESYYDDENDIWECNKIS